MNLKNAKSLSQREMRSVLPLHWIEIFDNMMSILKHSKYPSFKHAETFLTTGLSYIPEEEKDVIKHVKVKCSNKGEHDGKIYITMDICFYIKEDKTLWRFSKSIHVLKREGLQTYD